MSPFSNKVVSKVGMVSGRLTVVSYGGKSGRFHYWWCVCSCGGNKMVAGNNLSCNRIKSCGCLRRKHGKSDPIRNAYSSMKQRCYNRNHPDYSNYGGRGIRVCDRWKHSFSAFKADVSPRPENMSLDRIDNNGDYTPDNFRWTTHVVQIRNRRNTCMMPLDGVMIPIPEYSELTGDSIRGLYKKYYRSTRDSL